MGELTVEQVIKLVLGIFVVVAVIAGIYLIFKDKIIDFFQNLSVGNGTTIKLVFPFLN
jgi:hypothetical protein